MADLTDVFSESIPRPEAEAFLHKLKTAGYREAAKVYYRAGLGAVKDNPSKYIGGALGAAGFAAGAHKLNKPGPDGLSQEQKLTRAAADAFQKREKERKKPATLPEDLAGVSVRTSKEMSDVFAKHPRAAALSAAVIGAGAGSKLLPKVVRAVRLKINP